MLSGWNNCRLGWKRPEHYSKTIILYCTKNVFKTVFERSVAFKLCIFIFLRYPNSLTSVFFCTVKLFFSLSDMFACHLDTCSSLAGKEISHWMTSRLEKTWLQICLYLLATNTKRKPGGWVLFFSWEKVEKEISNSNIWLCPSGVLRKKKILSSSSVCAFWSNESKLARRLPLQTKRKFYTNVASFGSAWISIHMLTREGAY